MYITYGMTYEQFWYGDPWMVKDYAESYLLKRRVRNEELWLEGLYIYRAIRAVIASAFGGRNEKYLTQPFDFLPKTKQEKEQEVLEKRQKVIDYFNTFKLKGENKQ